jgi:hypothetical protein
MKIIAAAALALVALAACEEKTEPAHVDSVQTQLQSRKVMPAPEEWVVERYGVKSGVIEVRVTQELLSDQDTTGSGRNRVAWYTRYFDDFGARTAEYEYSDSARTRLVRTTIDEEGVMQLYMEGDSVIHRMGWPRFMLPNFNRLTDEMRTSYNIDEIEGRPVLGRECTGYSLLKDGAHSKLWVWKGILLYGEAGAMPERDIQPMIVEATSFQPDIVVPPEKFQLPPDVPVVDIDVSGMSN